MSIVCAFGFKVNSSYFFYVQNPINIILFFPSKNDRRIRSFKILRWLKTGCSKTPVKQGLPDSFIWKRLEKEALIGDVNDMVYKDAVQSYKWFWKKERWYRKHYCQRLKISYATHHGATKASIYYSVSLIKKIYESTIRMLIL